jgi:hypothetical protein
MAAIDDEEFTESAEAKDWDAYDLAFRLEGKLGIHL